MEGNDKGVKMKIHYAKIVLLFIFVICLININACQKCDPTDDIKRIAQEEAQKAAKQTVQEISRKAEEEAKRKAQEARQKAAREAQEKKDFIIKAIFALIIFITVAVLFRYGIRKKFKHKERIK